MDKAFVSLFHSIAVIVSINYQQGHYLRFNILEFDYFMLRIISGT